MLAHSRTTTEQRSRMDDLKLSNDFGLSSPTEIDGILPKQEGAYADGLDASDWINTDWKQLWTRRRTRAKQEIEESFSHSPPIFLTSNKSMPCTLMTST